MHVSLVTNKPSLTYKTNIPFAPFSLPLILFLKHSKYLNSHERSALCYDLNGVRYLAQTSKHLQLAWIDKTGAKVA